MKGIIATQARVLSPLYYHGLYVPDGSATFPRILTDTSMMFALAHALGMPPTLLPRSKPDYRTDLDQIPWRASLFFSEDATVMAPVRHIIDVEREGGYTETMQKNMASGNFKKTFYVHEIAPGACYQGYLFGSDPFRTYRTESLVVRLGVGRTGIVELTAIENDTRFPAQLNAATLALWGQRVPVAYRIIDTIQPTESMPAEEAYGLWQKCSRLGS